VAQRDARELRRGHRPELLDERPPLVVAGPAHPEPADRALAAAEHAPRLGLHAVEQRADGDLWHGDGEDALAAKAAAELARAARVRHEAVRLDAEGGIARLEDLDRRVAAVAVDRDDHVVAV